MKTPTPRAPCRRVLVLLALPALLWWPPDSALANESAPAVAEREQIRAERAAAESRYKAGEALCRERFAVTACIDELQQQRREALAGLRLREIELDEAQRKLDAEDNARRLQAKQAAALSKPPPAAGARAPAVAPGSAKAAASAPAQRQRPRSKTADDAAAAAERVAAQQRRTIEAQAHREQVEQRNAQRAARGKKSTPLPLPAPLPPASAASD